MLHFEDKKFSGVTRKTFHQEIKNSLLVVFVNCEWFYWKGWLESGQNCSKYSPKNFRSKTGTE